MSMDDEDEGAMQRGSIDVETLVKRLFSEDGGDDGMAEIYDSTRTADTPARLEISFSVGQVSMQEEEAMPLGEVIASHDLGAGDSDSYRNELVVRLDGLVEGHVCIVTGTHSCGEYSDDDYNASFSGTVIVVPESDADAEIVKANEEAESCAAENAIHGLRTILKRLEVLGPKAFGAKQVRDVLTDVGRMAAERL